MGGGGGGEGGEGSDKQVFFHMKKYGQNICVCSILGGSIQPPAEPPLDPHQVV